MERQDNNTATDKVLAFDTIFTSNQIKILKVLFFFLDSSMQKMLAIYIKFHEIRYILTYFNKHSSIGTGTPDFNLLCKEILPYCGPDEKRKIEQFSQMQQMMEQFKQISRTMEMMQELFPDGMPGFDFNTDSESDSDSCSGSSIPFNAEILSSLTGGGQNSEMFELLAAMMGSSNNEL